MKRSVLVLAALLLAASPARAAADPPSFTGMWSAKVPSPNGQRSLDVVFTFKTDGSALTGTASANGATFPLVDTRVSGDNIAFAVEGDSGRYEGTLSDGGIKMQAIYTSSENGTRRWAFVATRMLQEGHADAGFIAGKWAGDIPRGGSNLVHADFDFEVDGTTLGGVVHALDLDLPVKHGKIEGTRVSFNIGDTKGDYTGEIGDGVIRMIVKYSGGETGRVTFDFAIKRVTR
jgi:hypothetical protein